MNEMIQISPKALAMVTLALNIAGALLKHKIPGLDNKYIPHILVAVGALAAGAVDGWTFEVMGVGAMAALTATGLHQVGSLSLSAIKEALNKSDKLEPPAEPPTP